MKRVKRLLLRTLLWALGLSFVWVLALKWVPVYVTPLMVVRLVEQKIDGKPLKMHHKWVPLSEISTNMPLAVVASEDNLFMEHHGFDFDAMKQAIDEARRGKRNRGGSTISQQTAKNVFLWNGHSYIRKALEAYFTILIEVIWGKERIMEVYLNSIEMGDGIYGVAAVAADHFNKQPQSLNRTECARIAATLPNPRRFNSAHPSRYINKRTSQITRLMRLIADPAMGHGAKPRDKKKSNHK